MPLRALDRIDPIARETVVIADVVTALLTPVRIAQADLVTTWDTLNAAHVRTSVPCLGGPASLRGDKGDWSSV